MGRPERTATLLLVLTAFFWGGAFVAGKVALAELPPVTVAFWRFAVGAAVLVPLWLWREGLGSLPRGGRAWAGVAALGLLGSWPTTGSSSRGWPW